MLNRWVAHLSELLGSDDEEAGELEVQNNEPVEQPNLKYEMP